MRPKAPYGKRKLPEMSCNCSQELQDLRKDITSMLQKFTDTQEFTMNFMRENMIEMKTQLNDIKVATESLSNEQVVIQSQILDLNTKTTATENKIQSL